MATTLDNIASWVLTDYLNRANDTSLQTVCRTAAKDIYLMVCAAVPFDELMKTSAELALVAGQQAYDIVTLGITDLRAIANIRLTASSTLKRRLRRSSTRVYDSLSITTSSIPATYARFGTTIELSPPPLSSSYTLRFRYWSRPTLVASPNTHTTTLVTPLEWDELLKYETLFRVLMQTDQYDKAMALMQSYGQQRQQGAARKTRSFELGMIPRLWNDLLRTVSQAEGTDEDFNINPLMRAYSVR